MLQPPVAGPSSSSGTPYADASSGEHRLQGTPSQAAAQAAVACARQLMGSMRGADPAWGAPPWHALPRSQRFRGPLTYAQLLRLYGREPGSVGCQGGRGVEGECAGGDEVCTPGRAVTGGSDSWALSAPAPELKWEWMLDGVLGEIINMLEPLSVQRFRLVRRCRCS